MLASADHILEGRFLFTRSALVPSRRRVVGGLAALVAALALVLGSIPFAQSAEASVRSLSNEYKPHILGLPIVGDELRATTGTWNGAAPLFYSFAWRSTTKSLLSSTADYTPRKSDIGQVLTVRVTVQDGDNNTSYLDVSTAAVTASDVVNSARPKFSGGFAVGDTAKVSHGKFTSGSGSLIYTYAWSATDGQTSSPLPDTGPTHVITNADLGMYLSVVVTATSPTQMGSVTARTPGAVVPKIPFATGAGLTNANKGDLTGTASKNDVIIHDPDGKSDDGVFVYGYSKPTVLGWFALDSNKKFSVNYSDLPDGAHKLAVISQSGKLVGWLQVEREEGAASLSSTANLPIGIGAAVFVVLLIIGLVTYARLRRSRGSRPRRH
jgi:hypothetical protein